MHQNLSKLVAPEAVDLPYPVTRPASPDYVFALDAVHLERASHPKRRKGKLPEIPAGYSASFTLDPLVNVVAAKADGTRLGNAHPLRTLPAGVLTLCPVVHTRARHRVGYTVGRAGALAEGVLCPMCKHIYYFLTLAPSASPSFSNIGEYYEDVRKTYEDILKKLAD
jgi:hypothetical protein